MIISTAHIRLPVMIYPHTVNLGVAMLLLMCHVPLHAQGIVTVNADKNFDMLLELYKRQNESRGSVTGYRIHVMSSLNRSEIYNLKAKLYILFPDIKPYVSYQAPYFKLRAGNYFYKINAYRDLQRLLPHFPGCFIITDELKVSEL